MAEIETHAPRRRAGCEAGFTLLELLISLSLLAVMMAESYGVFSTAMSMVPRGEEAAERSGRLRAATSILAKQVRSTVNFPARTDGDDFYPYFWGTPYSFSFITAAPQLGGGEGLGWVTYWSDGNNLWLGERRIFSIESISGSQPETVHETLLLGGLSGTRFQYLQLEGEESNWRDDWDGLDEQTLPAAIRVTIQGLNLGQSYWVEEIPVMAVVYGLGAYDAEAAVQDQSDTSEDGGGPGMSPLARLRGKPGAPGDQRGFALVIVLWVFAVLFVVGAEFSQAMRSDASATVNFADETQSYYLASAAANLTFYRALRAHEDSTLGAPPPIEPGDVQQSATPLVEPDGEWHGVDLWGAKVSVRVSDEGGKIPINWVDDTVLNHVLANLNVPPKDASTISDSILDWRDKDDEHRLNGAETDYYQSLPRPYVAKNAALDSLEELLLVKGVTRELYYGGTEDNPIGLRDIFTIFTPRRRLNVAHAPPEVLRAFFGLDDKELEQILDVRNTSAPGLLDVLRAKVPDPRLSQILSSEVSPTVLTVEVQAQMPNSRVKSHIGAVIDLGESNEGVYVLRWMDQLPPVEVS